MSSSDSTQQNAAALPSPGTRTLVSFLLFVHLFCIALSLCTNLAASGLQERILQVLRPYVQTLHFELLNVPYHLTHADSFDVDHLIEMELENEQGDTSQITLPDVGWRGGSRYKRYQRLGRAMAFFASDPEQTSAAAWIAESVGGSLLKQHGARRGIIRCKQHHLQPLEVFTDGTKEERDPYSSVYDITIYEANVWITDDGKVQILKVSSAGEVAPVDK